MTAPLWCSAKIGTGRHKYGCSKSATVTRDGKLYCGTHDPEKVAAREQARQLQLQKEDVKLEMLHNRAIHLVEQFGMGHPDGYRYDGKNPVRGIALTFIEAEHLLLRLQKGGSK